MALGAVEVIMGVFVALGFVALFAAMRKRRAQ